MLGAKQVWMSNSMSEAGALISIAGFGLFVLLYFSLLSTRQELQRRSRSLAYNRLLVT